MKRLIQFSGVSTIFGGIFFILTNVALSSFIDFDAPISETAQTPIFFYRMIFAAIAVSFLLFGTIGLHLHQSKNSNNFEIIAFVFAFFGTAFTLANEWYQIFVIPELAVIAPEALTSLESSSVLSIYDIGTFIAVLSFSIGWILFSISMLKSAVYSRKGPILIIAGFLIIPILSSIATPYWGGTIGTSALGLAFCILGRELLLAKNEI